eukprot:TRINITY_DN8090_c0_g1_i1.p1 TRINITY_DN8090_c0_g1~~TRINITY_DN8090_c0_g1_i1.p1  ORF type:complete len:308 (+),score=35.05 TRINITY_DN8090_c0_g1_i1:26-925(+)
MPIKVPEHEIKITIFDPVNKVGYVLGYGGEASDVTYTDGLATWMGRRSKSVKRMFLCKRFLNGRCRALEACKSAHVDKKKIFALRQLYPTSEDNPSTPTLLYVPTIDKQIPVPARHILSLKDSSKPSLCTTTGCVSCDHDAHITPSYLGYVKTLLRQACCSRPSCLIGTNTQGLKTPFKQFFLRKNGTSTPTSVNYLAQTNGLTELSLKQLRMDPDKKALHVPPTMICRLHQRIACKWGLECSNVHICRAAYPNLTSQESGKLLASTVSSGSSDSTASFEGRGEESDDEPPELLEDDEW